MSERSKPRPSDADVIAFALDHGWKRKNGHYHRDMAYPEGSRWWLYADTARALAKMREDYAAAHPPVWTVDIVVSEFGFPPVNSIGSGVFRMAHELAAHRNAAREPDDGKWIGRAASAIHLYWNGYGSSATDIAAIIRKHAPGSAT